jgi:hypothetical protein
MVEPDIRSDDLALVDIDSIYRAAHLMPAYRTARFIYRSLGMHDSFDFFSTFFILINLQTTLPLKLHLLKKN